MWITSLPANRSVTSVVRRWSFVVLIVMLLAPITPGAQTIETIIVMRSGLHTVFEGHTLLTTVSESGSPTATTRVRIFLHSADDRLVARADGVLRRGEPVRLELTVPRGIGRAQGRVTVELTAAPNQGSEPTAVLEDLDNQALTVEQRIVCSGPPQGRDGPATLAICPGWHVSNLTAGS